MKMLCALEFAPGIDGPGGLRLGGFRERYAIGPRRFVTAAKGGGVSRWTERSAVYLLEFKERTVGRVTRYHPKNPINAFRTLASCLSVVILMFKEKTHLIRNSSTHHTTDLSNLLGRLLNQDLLRCPNSIPPHTRIGMSEPEKHLFKREAIGSDWLP
jgi:hypothetical protein